MELVWNWLAELIQYLENTSWIKGKSNTNILLKNMLNMENESEWLSGEF